VADENGNVLRERIEQLRHKLRGTEQAVRFLAEKGAQNNEQVRVHDTRLDEHDRRLHEHDEALLEERKEREAGDVELRGFGNKILWLLVLTAFSLATAAVSFALGVVPT
jgi:chromosome segregation ATPase